MPSLSDAAIRNVKPGTSPIKLFDGGGLYLLIKPSGSRLWKMKYRIHRREKSLSFGPYPKVSLKAARDQRDDAKRQLRAGLDPSVQKKLSQNAGVHTFKAIALEWLSLLENPPQNPKRPSRPPLAEKTLERKRGWLQDYVFPEIGSRPIDQIESPEMLAVLRRVEKHGFFETTHRVCSTCSRVFRYGIASDRCKRDPTADLRGALAPVVVTHHAALTDPRDVGGLLRAVDGYRGEPVTCIALKLVPLHFLRSADYRFARWHEIDFDAREWRVPPGRMKMKELFVIPLADQALALFHELHRLTYAGPDSLIFPGLRSHERPISENTINAALRRMGYTKDEMTGHGWRTIASTLLNEQGWHPDIIELQLNHEERDEMRGTYNRAQRLADRRKMMQAWADYLDSLRARDTAMLPVSLPEPA
jgi:integrase